ncbi:unnamed protein product, partial [Allacma fusca]
ALTEQASKKIDEFFDRNIENPKSVTSLGENTTSPPNSTTNAIKKTLESRPKKLKTLIGKSPLLRESSPKLRATNAYLIRNLNIFRKRYGCEPKFLEPFYPINSYPFFFTAVAHVTPTGDMPSAIFANDILLLGDGHAEGIARRLMQGKTFSETLDPKLYRRDMTVQMLIDYLSEFKSLPSKIMLAIGTYEAHIGTDGETFDKAMHNLCKLLAKFQVTDVYFLPLISNATHRAPI